MPRFKFIRPSRRTVFLGLLLVLSASLAFLGLVLPFAAQPPEEPLRLGDVAAEDILAPYSQTFESQVLTDEQRQNAVRNVAAVYTSIDPSIARQQIERLRAALDYISSVRADIYATDEQQLADLSVLVDIRLTEDSAKRILVLSDLRWQVVQQEALVVLEEVMRNTIRTDQLDDTRRSLPAMVNLSLPEDQAYLVVELVLAFVTANSFYDEPQTQLAYQQARDGVTPVSRSFVANEVIVQHGQVVTPPDLEALQLFGLNKTQPVWVGWGGALALAGVMSYFLILYMRRNLALLNDLRSLAVIVFLFFVFFYGARLSIPDHTVLPYLYPVMAYGLVLTSLFQTELAMVVTLVLSVMISYGMPNALDLTLFYALSSFFGILILGRAQRVITFFWAGIVIAISGSIVIVAYRLIQSSTDLIGLVTLAGAAGVNGAISAGLSLILQYMLAHFLGRTTALQLVELSRPDQPLLQFILRNAPGTYQHSIQVASLAEQAAEYIGADALLTRVGALYHDVGKALNPGFFIENQIAGELNPHHNLPPEVSAATIIRHVTEGQELARKHRLPLPLRAFIDEHHGNSLTRYQYVKAVEAAGGDESQVDPSLFRYPGPRPRSRETALLMLADSCEARVRAGRPKDENELRQLIKGVIDDRVKQGQLDDTDLTLKDLDRVVMAFTASLKGVYHPRIQYPTLESVAAGPKSVSPTLPVDPPTTPRYS